MFKEIQRQYIKDCVPFCYASTNYATKNKSTHKFPVLVLRPRSADKKVASRKFRRNSKVFDVNGMNYKKTHSIYFAY